MQGPKSVSDIVDAVQLSQPAVSQHLKALKEYKLVTDTKKGQEVFYQIDVAYTTNLLTTLVSSLNQSKKH